MTISVIVAVSDNGVIGKDGKIPWKLSTDMKRFREITTGHTVVMWRKVFHSLNCDPLFNRYNIVVTCKDYEMYLYSDENLYIALSMDEAIRTADAYKHQLGHTLQETFIIGGQQIYDEIFKTPELIHRVYLTRVHCEVEGDTFFRYAFSNTMSDMWMPNTRDVWWEEEDGSMVKWKMIEQTFIPKSDKDEYDSTFQVWENRS